MLKKLTMTLTDHRGCRYCIKSMAYKLNFNIKLTKRRRVRVYQRSFKLHNYYINKLNIFYSEHCIILIVTVAKLTKLNSYSMNRLHSHLNFD